MLRDVILKIDLKNLVFVACLGPSVWIVFTIINSGLGSSSLLGANPIEAINRYLGDWAIRFLLATLALTPIRRITGWKKVMRYRRMVGLFAFFYVCLHLVSYIGLDQFFDWQEIWLDITRRNYITVGMVSFILLTILAATSTNRIVKKLGGKRWSQIHWLVYPASIIACLHFFMMRKGVQVEPILYSVICAIFLGYRIIVAWNKKA
jgi:sulfoxide reductase heme-binding subunit YedZ